MSAVIAIVMPLLLIALIGFVAARLEVLTQEQVMGLGRFLIALAIPAVLILSLSKLDVEQVFGSHFLFAYAAVGIPLIVLLWWFANVIWKTGASAATTMALGVAIPNNIILGFPLSQQLFGDDSLSMFVAVVLVENAVYLPVAYLVYEVTNHEQRISGAALMVIAKKVLGNPITVSVIVGLALAFTGTSIPGPIAAALGLLGNAVTGMALFYVGAALAYSEIGAITREVLASVVVRLVIAPVLALVVALQVPGLTAIEQALLVLFCAPPCFSILPAIAAPYGEGALGARIQVMGTALSVVSLPCVLFFLA